MTTAADIIVASVQANPPGGDVAVSPAVRVLVEEIVRLRVELVDMKSYYTIIDDEKDDEITRLRHALVGVREVIENDPDNLNLESVVDTVWMSPIETMVEYIGVALGEATDEAPDLSPVTGL